MTLPGPVSEIVRGVKGYLPRRRMHDLGDSERLPPSSVPTIAIDVAAAPSPKIYPEPLFPPPETFKRAPIAIAIPDKGSDWEDIKTFVESSVYRPELLCSPNEDVPNPWETKQLEEINRIRELVFEKFPRTRPHELQTFVRKEVHGYFIFYRNLTEGRLQPPANEEERKVWEQQTTEYKADSAMFFKQLYRHGWLTDEQAELLIKEANIPSWFASPDIIAQYESRQAQKLARMRNKVAYYSSHAADPIQLAFKTLAIHKENEIDLSQTKELADQETQRAWGLTRKIFPSLFADPAKAVNRTVLLQAWESLLDHESKTYGQRLSRPEETRRKNLASLRESLEKVRLLTRGNMSPTLLMLANAAFYEDNFGDVSRGLVPQTFDQEPPTGVSLKTHHMFARVYCADTILANPAVRLLRNEKKLKKAITSAYLISYLGMTSMVGGWLGQVGGQFGKYLGQFKTPEAVAQGMVKDLVSTSNKVTSGVLDVVTPVEKITQLPPPNWYEIFPNKKTPELFSVVGKATVSGVGFKKLEGQFLLPFGTEQTKACNGQVCHLNVNLANANDPENWAVYEYVSGQNHYYFDSKGEELKSTFIVRQTFGNVDIEQKVKKTTIEVDPVIDSVPDRIEGEDFNGNPVVISNKVPDGFPDVNVPGLDLVYGGIKRKFLPGSFRYMLDAKNPNAFWVMGVFKDKNGVFTLARLAYFDRNTGMIYNSQSVDLVDPKHSADHLWEGPTVRTGGLQTSTVYRFNSYYDGKTDQWGSMKLEETGIAIHQDEEKKPPVIAELVPGTNLFRVPAGKDRAAPITIYQRRSPSPQAEEAHAALMAKLLRESELLEKSLRETKMEEVGQAQAQWESQYRVKTVVDVSGLWLRPDGTIDGWGVSQSGMGPAVLVTQNYQAPIGEPREIAHVPGSLVTGSIQTPSRIIEASFAVGGIKTVVGNPLKIILAPSEKMPAPVLRKMSGQTDYYYLYPDARNKGTVDIYRVFKGQGPNLTVRRATSEEKAFLLTTMMASK